MNRDFRVALSLALGVILTVVAWFLFVTWSLAFDNEGSNWPIKLLMVLLIFVLSIVINITWVVRRLMGTRSRWFDLVPIMIPILWALPLTYLYRLKS